ncbi:MAG: hypothetical protein HXX10_07495 [Rhodoplanes sp.]|uniref:Gp49 family protein n=1 Tax=Rhodoplanes sp. TaxID=1968906 RepID=UPI0017D597DF|nr:Gp49 family protein [Rhodoplanes sp.]NVO13864.1 hypothetical protein [Rhodoplanes sp.]
MSIEHTDAESIAVAEAPRERVALADIEAAIQSRYNTRGIFAVTADSCADSESLRLLSICILIMRNGFMVIGKSAPASAKNFNAELGCKFAYEDAIRQLWPLMGFALRDKLMA